MKKRTAVYAGERSSHQIKGDAPPTMQLGALSFLEEFFLNNNAHKPHGSVLCGKHKEQKNKTKQKEVIKHARKQQYVI